MSAIVELVPTTKITPDSGTEYTQPTDTVVDVSNYTEAALLITVSNLDVGGGGTIRLDLQTAVENREEHYVGFISDVVTYSGTPEFPNKTYVYLQGSTATSTPGFARYLRARVDLGNAANAITLGIKAVMKP